MEEASDLGNGARRLVPKAQLVIQTLKSDMLRTGSEMKGGQSPIHGEDDDRESTASSHSDVGMVVDPAK